VDYWKKIVPDEHHDWVNQRDPSFKQFLKIGDKKDSSSSKIFEVYSCGVQTNRDAWVYNNSRKTVYQNVLETIQEYNSLLASGCSSKQAIEQSRKIKWASSLVALFDRGKRLEFDESRIVESVYRPFHRQWLYFESGVNHRPYLNEQLFPNGKGQNLAIAVSGKGFRGSLSVLIASYLPCLNFGDMDNSQCFPLYAYENNQSDLFSGIQRANRIDAISNASLVYFRDAYSGKGASIAKKDVFYYAYGILNSKDYHQRFTENLRKELPRIPAVKKFEDFQAFSQAGRDLAHWHLDYETVDCHEVTLDVTDSRLSLDKHSIAVPKTGTRDLRKKLNIRIS
jgi:predicted helicase